MAEAVVVAGIVAEEAIMVAEVATSVEVEAKEDVDDMRADKASLPCSLFYPLITTRERETKAYIL